MNYLVELYNSETDSYAFHTLFAANEGVASCIAENLAQMLGSENEWHVHDVTYIDDEWPIS